MPPACPERRRSDMIPAIFEGRRETGPGKPVKDPGPASSPQPLLILPNQAPTIHGPTEGDRCSEAWIALRATVKSSCLRCCSTHEGPLWGSYAVSRCRARTAAMGRQLSTALLPSQPVMAWSAARSYTARATSRSAPSGRGRCSFAASSQGPDSQRSHSSGCVRITGMAFGWTLPTSSFGAVVRKANRSSVVSPSLTFRTDNHPRTSMPAKNIGASPVVANH